MPTLHGDLPSRSPEEAVESENSGRADSDSSNKGKLSLSVKKGAEKRSLSIFSSITPVEPQVKRRVIMDDEGMSGDEMEGDDMAQSPDPPPNNFSLPSNTMVVSGRVNCSSGNVLSSSKKIAIKNFRKKTTNNDFLSTSWKELEKSIIAIQKCEKAENSLEQLYKIVENVCENMLAGEMYDKLLTKIRDDAIARRTTLSENKSVSGHEFLEMVESTWMEYCQQMIMVRSVFLYLDRTYILQNASIMSIWESSLMIFREEIMENSYLQKRLVKDILATIKQERTGVQVDRTLLRSLLRMLTNLQIYKMVFEEDFLNATSELFNYEGVTLSRDLETSDFLHHVDRRLKEESSRIDFYLDESTRKPLIALTEKCLLEDHIDGVVSRGLECLLQENRLDDLRLLFFLVGRVKDGVNILKTGFSAYIKKVGKVLVTDNDNTMVDGLMEFKDKLDTIVSSCFENSEKFMQTLRDAFDYFVNTRPNKPAELIAKYMDAKLRTANKEASDEELDHLMDKVITLFRFIQGKDVFEAFYKKDLAKRLLLGRSASVDAEKAMLSKLRQECGSGFTQKLEGMFKDMELSKDLAVSFKQHCDHEAGLGRSTIDMDFNVHVLTMGQWPSYTPVEVTLPPQLCNCLKIYQEMYNSKHNGRKLQWQHSLGQCVLKATFRPNCVKELQVSLYQGMVLLLFNDKNDWNTKDIREATKIDSKELIRTLISLSCAKIRVLNKIGKPKEIADDDEFKVNTELKEKLYRIKISQVQMKETPEEHKETEESVNQDRQYQIDAAIVRVMKTRKTLAHQQLIAELFSQLRFPVKSSDLKVRIGSLIERDYLCRDDDPNTYKYVA